MTATNAIILAAGCYLLYQLYQSNQANNPATNPEIGGPIQLSGNTENQLNAPTTMTGSGYYVQDVFGDAI